MVCVNGMVVVLSTSVGSNSMPDNVYKGVISVLDMTSCANVLICVMAACVWLSCVVMAKTALALWKYFSAAATVLE